MRRGAGHDRRLRLHIDAGGVDRAPGSVVARAQPRALSNLLLLVAVLVFAMAVVGGITRLTESGLSITQWKPISGAIPPLTQERRKELAKVVGKQTEEARVAVRSARRDAMDMVKDAEKDKQITEDERKNGEKKIQELTDKFIAMIDDIAKAKEKEIMEL